MTRGRCIDVIRGLAAAAVLGALIGGVPAGLYLIAGSPLPDHLPDRSEFIARLMQPDTGYTLFLGAVRTLGWVAWSMFLIATGTEVIAHLRSRPAAHLPGFGPLQPGAARLVAAAALVVGTSTPTMTPIASHPAPAASASATTTAPHALTHAVSHAASHLVSTTPASDAAPDAVPGAVPGARAGAAEPAAESVVESVVESGMGAAGRSSAGAIDSIHMHAAHAVHDAEDPEGADPGPYREYRVKPHDTLWRIARRLLGDGRRYKQIAELNDGRPQPGGGRLTDSHWLRPGWRLRVPAALAPGLHRPQQQPGRHTHTVKPDDTLWAIARTHLGPDATPAHIDAYADALYRLNRGRPQPGGDTLANPALIKPGWRLQLPGNRPNNRPNDQPNDRRGNGRGRPSPPGTPPRTGKPPNSSPPRRPPATTPSPAPAIPSTSPSTTQPTSPSSTPAPSSPQPATPSAPAPARSGEAPAPEVSQPREPGQNPRPNGDGHGIWLPAGGFIGLGLAAAVSVAVAATRAHRRRRRSPDPDRLLTPDPEPAAAPAVGTARKAHLEFHADQGKPIPSDADLLRDDFTAREPTQIEVGMRAGQPVAVALAGMSVGLTGPGAADAARAIAAELLAGAHRNRVELVIPHQDAATLLTASAGDLAQLRQSLDGLVVPPTHAAAAAHMEAEVIHRARMMERHQQTDVASLRSADPAEPLPTVVVIGAATRRWQDTLASVLAQGTGYCLGGLLLGRWPAGTTCHVDASGTITHAEGPAADTWTGTQLFHLDAAEAAQMLDVVRAAHTSQPDHPQPPAPEQPLHDGPASSPTSGPTSGAGPAPRLPEPPQRDDTTTTTTSTTAEPTGDGTGQPLVQIRLLGPVRVAVSGGPVATGLRRISKALLAYLALHPEGVTRDQGIEALWPDRDPEAGTTMFHTAVNNVRKTLRAATGLGEPMFITYIDSRYHLDPHLTDVDLWHVLDALNTASTTENDTEKIDALRRVADLYTGELADDVTYEWAELERERFRRAATDALVSLARLLHADHPDQALAALEQAVSHDVYSEPLYRSVMRLQVGLGRTDAVRRTYHLLENHLNDLDLDASPETVELLNDLLHADQQRNRRRSGGQATTPPGQRSS